MDRKELILNTIIKEHIKTGAPVGSGVLVDKYNLDISPATVRNEMADLEEEGYIKQPHTSAGRIPTEKAYNFYLNSLKGKKLSASDLELFEKLLCGRDEKNIKQTAREMARISGNTVFWATDKDHFFYTGLSNLISQPEFAQVDLMRHISLMMDRVDEIIDDIFDDMEFDTKVLLGSENPFGDSCSTVLVKYKLDGKEGLFGILGPMRMNYEKNLGLVDFINKKLIEG
ncbi:MAG: hypothetical protein ABIE43_05340 [Patescibacteria group bacterium]